MTREHPLEARTPTTRLTLFPLVIARYTISIAWPTLKVTNKYLQRNSLELDESLGILSPGEMKDFTASSMTQSFASVTSLPRDVSCEDFDTSTGDKTVTEEFNQQVFVFLQIMH